jgi:deoxycytidylate deaminase
VNLDRIVEFAIEEALKSEYKIKLGCVIFNKNKIVSKGHNYKQKSTRSITKKFLKWEFSLHAEVDAIIKSRTELKGMSLLVVRINNNKKLMYAKPCKHCQEYIQFVGVKKIYYSSKDGGIICM